MAEWTYFLLRFEGCNPRGTHPMGAKVRIAAFVTWKQHFRLQISSEEQVSCPLEGIYCYVGRTIGFPLEGSLAMLVLFV